MTFLNPIYLWSLLGILIPVAIHLWSRRKVVKIKVGSTKLLRKSEPRQTSTVRPNELWLLFLRILTILLLTLILSEPQFKSTTKNDSLLYIIEPSLITNQKTGNLLEGIPEEAIRFLAREFPEIGDYDYTVAENRSPNYWQLAQEMKVLPADSIVVLTKGFISGIKGKRPVTPSHINWIVLDSDDESNQIIEATKKGDSLELLSVFSSADKLQFERKKVSPISGEVEYNNTKDSIRISDKSIPIYLEESINILLVYQDSLVREEQFISAAYRSIAKFLKRPINIAMTTKSDSVNLDTYDASVWLGVEPVEDLKKTRLVFKPDPLADELIERGNTKNEYFLTHSLNSENIVTEHLPEKLLALLNPHVDLDEKIESYDKRVVTIEELSPSTSEEPKSVLQASVVDISPWLWALLLLILIMERIIAKYRKQ